MPTGSFLLFIQSCIGMTESGRFPSACAQFFDPDISSNDSLLVLTALGAN